MEERSALARKAEEVEELILELESPRDAATVLGYVQAKLLLAAGAEHETDARRLLADSAQGVLACWAVMKGNGWTQGSTVSELLTNPRIGNEAEHGPKRRPIAPARLPP